MYFNASPLPNPEEGGSAVSAVKINYADSVHLASSKCLGGSKSITTTLVLFSKYMARWFQNFTLKSCFIDFTEKLGAFMDLNTSYSLC